MGNDALAVGIKAGNINMAGATEVEVMDLSSESKDAQRKHAELLRQYEATKRARTVAVPTLLEDIKTYLRALGHPITLFGETPMDRRDRLRDIVAEMELNDEEINRIQTMLKERESATSATVTEPV